MNKSERATLTTIVMSTGKPRMLAVVANWTMSINRRIPTNKRLITFLLAFWLC